MDLALDPRRVRPHDLYGVKMILSYLSPMDAGIRKPEGYYSAWRRLEFYFAWDLREKIGDAIEEET